MQKERETLNVAKPCQGNKIMSQDYASKSRLKLHLQWPVAKNKWPCFY